MRRLFLCFALICLAFISIFATNANSGREEQSSASAAPMTPPTPTSYSTRRESLDVVLTRVAAQYARNVDTWLAAMAQLHEQELQALRQRQRPGSGRAVYVYGTGACGGDLPPCSVLACESGGNLTAQNPHSTASGKWQILDSTWRTEDSNGDEVRDSYQGYSRAMDAPESVQDQRAREIYAGGAGRSQWVC